jgi:hypothetical protein
MKLLESLVYSASNCKVFIKKHSPTILTVCSVGATLGAVVTTATSTWKAKDVIEAHNAEINDIHEELKEHDDPETRKKLAKKYIKTGLDMTDLYLAPVILTGVSIASSIASNKISNSRIAALGASYTLLKQMYDKYRERVKEKYGEEADQDIMMGAKEVEKEVVDKKGKVKKVKEKVYDINSAINNPYAILLGDGIESNLQGNHWYDIALLQSIEKRLTYDINANGYILMMDIANALGVKPSSKQQHDIWSTHGIVKSQARIENAIAKAKAENREVTEEELILANRLDLGLKNPINDNYRSGDEPMVWILPNIDGDIMSYLYPSRQEQSYMESVTD